MKLRIFPTLIAIPLVLAVFASIAAGPYFTKTASAQYGGDRVLVCLPITTRVESYAVVTVPTAIADRFLSRPGVVLADERGKCPGIPQNRLANVLALSIIDRVIDRLSR